MRKFQKLCENKNRGESVQERDKKKDKKFKKSVEKISRENWYDFFHNKTTNILEKLTGFEKRN